MARGPTRNLNVQVFINALNPDGSSQGRLCQGNTGLCVDICSFSGEVLTLLHPADDTPATDDLNQSDSPKSDENLLPPNWHPDCLTILNTCWHRHGYLSTRNINTNSWNNILTFCLLLVCPTPLHSPQGFLVKVPLPEHLLHTNTNIQVVKYQPADSHPPAC